MKQEKIEVLITIAWRLRREGCIIVLLQGPPILPSSGLHPRLRDSWMNYLKVIVHFRYLIPPGVPRAYMFAMEKDEVP